MTSTCTVAVTGASGFLGSYLLPRLTDEGFRVIAIARRPPTAPVEYRPSDYDAGSLRSALADVDVVVHLAARRALREDDPLDLGPFLEPNVATLRGLVDGARVAGAHRVVLASSRAVYPVSSPQPAMEGRDEAPESAYGLSKLFAERYLETLAAAAGLDPISLRFAALYGEGERDSPVLMRFARLAGHGEPLVLKGNVARRIDELYVLDAVEAIVAAVRAGGVVGPVNIGSGEAVRVRDLAMAVNATFGNRSEVTEEDARDGPEFDDTLDIAKARRLLDWTPRFTLEDGLRELRRLREAAWSGGE